MPLFLRAGSRLVNMNAVRFIDILPDVPAGKAIHVHVERESRPFRVEGEEAAAILELVTPLPKLTGVWSARCSIGECGEGDRVKAEDKPPAEQPPSSA